MSEIITVLGSKGQIAQAKKLVKNGQVEKTNAEIYRDHDPNINTWIVRSRKPYIVSEIGLNTYDCYEIDQDDTKIDLCHGFKFCSATPNTPEKLCKHITAVRIFSREKLEEESNDQ